MKKKLLKTILAMQRPITWVHDNTSRTQFLIIAGILVGVTAGGASVILKTIVHYLHLLITHNYHIEYQYYIILIFPFIGILLTVLIIKIFFKGKIGKGIANILYEIAQKASFVHKDKMYSQIITSSITVGLGGSAGLEAPIVVTGSAIGSNFGRTYKLNYKDRTVLLASGAAAGIAAVFNAPIAGVMFAIEVLLVDLSISELIPLIISAVCGALFSKIILQENILFFFELQQKFDYTNIPFYVGLGIFSGFISVYYARMTHRVEHFFEKFKNKTFTKAIVGGCILVVLYLFFPPLFGEGYGSIKILATGEPTKLLENSMFEPLGNYTFFFLIFIGLVMLIKVVATSVTISSGGNGGNFAPSLFVGAFMGFFYSHLINFIRPNTLPESNFTIVGMAGILSGVIYAPLTGIFLIAEITGGYDLMIPLMVVSVASFFIAKHFEPYSMDTKKLANKGQILTSDKDNNILTLMKTSEIIEKDIETINYKSTLGDLVKIIQNCHRNIFAVINEKSELVGVIMLDDVRDIMFRQELYNTLIIKQLLKKPPITIELTDEMRIVMKKFDESQAWNLPVVSNKKYIGFISKSSIFMNYRTKLKTQIGII